MKWLCNRCMQSWDDDSVCPTCGQSPTHGPRVSDAVGPEIPMSADTGRPRGGPRPNSGGARKGAGRPPLDRIPAEEAAAALDVLAGGGSLAALARRIGVSPQAVTHARKRGMSLRQLAEWRERAAQVSVTGPR